MSGMGVYGKLSLSGMGGWGVSDAQDA